MPFSFLTQVSINGTRNIILLKKTNDRNDILYLSFRIAVLFLCENCPKGVLKVYMPGNFRTKVHFEKWDMAFNFENTMFGMRSLDGHGKGRQATDSDELLTKIPKIAVPRPSSAFPESQIQRFMLFRQNVRP